MIGMKTMEVKSSKIDEDWKQTLTFNCDVCGKKIISIENMIDAGDKVVCSKECLNKAISEFMIWANGGLTRINNYKVKRLLKDE